MYVDIHEIIVRGSQSRLTISRKTTKHFSPWRRKWKIRTVGRKNKLIVKKIAIHYLHFRDCQDRLLGLFVSYLVADVPYFIDPGKVVRDLQTLKMCIATMETNFERLKRLVNSFFFFFFFRCLLTVTERN